MPLLITTSNGSLTSSATVIRYLIDVGTATGVGIIKDNRPLTANGNATYAKVVSGNGFGVGP